ncbi:hypothetical protein [Gemmiger formicilis]|jgi:hypothetical protein|uniref:hypothetical protein n=1 Tax=Gemmiger formicilis TaxID=745368 RepID=UPI002052CD18|nr:MAG TPA: hypothetical protein [Caudoviricetes sp.]
MTYTVNKSLSEFPFWSGACYRADKLTIEQLERLDDIIPEWMEWGEYSPNGHIPSDDEINNLFWFDENLIARMLGFKNWEALERHNSGEDEDDDEEESNDE